MKIKSLYKFTVCCLLFTVCCSYAQINLIKNPSFEQFSGCPTINNQIYLANFWSGLNSSSIDTNECNGEYYNACANSVSGDYYGVPGAGVFLNFQNARTGKAYIGIDLFQVPSGSVWVKRTFAQSNLAQTLTSGKTYCFTLWANLSNLSKYQCNNFMAYFDNGNIDTAKCGYPVAIIPQVTYSPNIAITDTLNWVQIKGSFIASGTENTVTIGNFKTDAQSTISIFNTNGFWSSEAYYLIDDVSLIPSDLPAWAGRDTSICTEDSVYIGRPNEVGLDDDCVWYINNVATYTTAGLWVKPAVTTSYVLEQNICGTITYDTVNVTVNCLGIKQYAGSNKQISVYPNPASQNLNITITKNGGGSNTIKLIDVTGQTISCKILKGTSEVIDVSGFAKGVYILFITGDNNTIYSKVIVE